LCIGSQRYSISPVAPIFAKDLNRARIQIFNGAHIQSSLVTRLSRFERDLSQRSREFERLRFMQTWNKRYADFGVWRNHMQRCFGNYTKRSFRTNKEIYEIHMWCRVISCRTFRHLRHFVGGNGQAIEPCSLVYLEVAVRMRNALTPFEIKHLSGNEDDCQRLDPGTSDTIFECRGTSRIRSDHTANSCPIVRWHGWVVFVFEC